MQSRLLNGEIRSQLIEMFQKELIHPVELVYFSSNGYCDTCQETQQLLEELIELSSLLTLTSYDIDEQPEFAHQYDVSLAPTLLITGKNAEKSTDYQLRFLGIPSGYEFSSLIHSIALVSHRDSGLKADIRKELKELRSPVDLKVFVTPT
jgi:alkyl hydroperoxide reductase subunit AhpF